MPRPKNLSPSYLKHKATGRGRFVWTDPAGNHHDKLLPGKFGSAESKAAFQRTHLECQVSPAAVARGDGRQYATSVNEILLRYLAHAAMRYPNRDDGRPPSALVETRLTIRAIRTLYGDLPAAEFGPLKLQAVQQSWVAAGLARATCNKRLDIAKRAFRYAVSQELVPKDVYEQFRALDTVERLQKGRTGAREPDPIGPVDDATVDATLPHLNRHVRALVEVQRLTGMRPGEVTRLKLSEIDTAGDVWFYRPKKHKTAHKGKSRVIAIGKRAQAIITAFRTKDDTEYLFSPRKAVAEHNAARRAARKTKPSPGEVRLRAAEKKHRVYKDHYTTHRYDVAVARAAEKAGVPHWAPNQLRHSFATRVRKEHGLEAVQVSLGHSRADVTQVYAERNEALAAAVAAKIG